MPTAPLAFPYAKIGEPGDRGLSAGTLCDSAEIVRRLNGN